MLHGTNGADIREGADHDQFGAQRVRASRDGRVQRLDIFKGNLMDLRDTLRSLADLVLDVEQHETLAELDEDDYVRRVGAMRADIDEGRRMAKTAEELDAETLALHESCRPTQEGSK